MFQKVCLRCSISVSEPLTLGHEEWSAQMAQIADSSLCEDELRQALEGVFVDEALYLIPAIKDVVTEMPEKMEVKILSKRQKRKARKVGWL